MCRREKGGDEETGGEQDESMRVEKEHGEEETMARSDLGLLAYTLLVFRFYFLLPQNLVWQVNFQLPIE